MFKLNNQFKIIIFLFIVLGFLFLIIINNKIYSFPGINLDIRKTQIEEEKNNLVQQLTNIFNDTTLNPQTRLSRMYEMSERLDIIYDNIRIINQ
ncbi:MAG: effector protein [Phytoplasma sp.]|uniref:effector protein n=1 Tax=Phytoplasma sp. TaxID=2155 RepID=UPI002B40484C|nr:effector protein [Phytoplasma sp.]WRH06589.1 MAG: effector protein [Phytoplasma sp.]